VDFGEYSAVLLGLYIVYYAAGSGRWPAVEKDRRENYERDGMIKFGSGTVAPN
jgi:hypothetical protein